LLEQIYVVLCGRMTVSASSISRYIWGTVLTFVEPPLPFLDLWPTARDPIQTLDLATFEVEIVNGSPRECWHPKFSLVSRVFEPFRYPRYPSLLDQRFVEDLDGIVFVVYHVLLLRRATTPAIFAKEIAADHAHSPRSLISETAKERPATSIVVAIAIAISI